MNGHGTQSTKDQFLLPEHCVQYTEVGTLQDDDGCSFVIWAESNCRKSAEPNTLLYQTFGRLLQRRLIPFARTLCAMYQSWYTTR